MYEFIAVEKREQVDRSPLRGFCGFHISHTHKEPISVYPMLSPIVFTSSSSSFYIRSKHTEETRKSSESDDESVCVCVFFLHFRSLNECIKHRKPKLIKGIKRKIKENERKALIQSASLSLFLFYLFLFDL